MIEALLGATKDDKSAAALQEQMRLAVLERDAQALERAASEFKQRYGRPIFSLEELVVTGFIPRIPPDPFGGRYLWNAAEQRVHSSENPFRFRVRSGPHAPSGLQYHPKRDLEVP